MRRKQNQLGRMPGCAGFCWAVCWAAVAVQAAEPAAVSVPVEMATTTNLAARIQQADLGQVYQEMQAFSTRLRLRRTELLQQPELAKLAAADQKTQADYRQKLTANPEYAAAVKQREEDAARFRTLAARVRQMRGHYINHRTPALAAELPASRRLGRVQDCEFCEEAYGANPAGDPEVFRRQNEKYLAETVACRELLKGMAAGPRREKELIAQLCQADAEVDRLATAAAQSAKGLEQALNADPQLRQLAEQNALWQKRGVELRKLAKPPAKPPAKSPVK